MIDDPREYLKGIINAMRKSQRQFCEHAGLKPSNFSAYLNGTRLLSKEDCLKLEKTYGISFMDIMSHQISEWYKQHKNKEK